MRSRTVRRETYCSLVTPLVLSAKVPGVARSDVRLLGDRRVVWLEVTSDAHRGEIGRAHV